MESFVCQLSTSGNCINASITRHNGGQVENHVGSGPCVADALSGALRINSVVFQSSEDELITCVAAIRNKSLRINVDGRFIRAFDVV